MENKTDKIKSKKQSFFYKIKHTVIKNSSKNKVEEKKEVSEKNAICISKKTFFDLYEKAKNQEIEMSTLDPEIARKILSIAIEELDINSRKMDEKLKTLEISLDNAKRYNKELEILKKVSKN